MHHSSKGAGKRGHVVADTNVYPFARARNICCLHKFRVRDTKSVFEFVQKHFVFATNVSRFVQPKKHYGQQCVRNNVFSFDRALTHIILESLSMTFTADGKRQTAKITPEFLFFCCNP